MFVPVVAVFTACIGFALFALNPLPNVCGFLSVGVDDKVFVDRFLDLFLDFAASCVIGDVRNPPAPLIRGENPCWTFKDDHPAFLGDGGELICNFAYCDTEKLRIMVPTEFLRKKVFKFGFFEVFSCISLVKHWEFLSIWVCMLSKRNC